MKAKEIVSKLGIHGNTTLIPSDEIECVIECVYDLGKVDGEPKWVSVEDALPEHCWNVLLWDRYECVLGKLYNLIPKEKTAVFVTDNDDALSGITHWMPLPKQPQP